MNIKDQYFIKAILINTYHTSLQAQQDGVTVLMLMYDFVDKRQILKTPKLISLPALRNEAFLEKMLKAYGNSFPFEEDKHEYKRKRWRNISVECLLRPVLPYII